MASACVNNNIGVSPEKFPSYGWLSPRISFSREEDPSKKPSSAELSSESSDPADFEFRLEEPVAMLPADELFSDGKLVPLHLSSLKPSTVAIKSLGEPNRYCNISSFDPYSPKAPRCSSRWKELLGLKKLYNNSNGSKADPSKTTTFSSSSSTTHTKSSLKHFLHRSSKTSSSSSSISSSLDGSCLNLPLLKDSDCESVSLSSSRLSLSSSSSGHEHEDLPRLSLDSDKSLNPNPNPYPNPFADPPRMRLVKPRECSNNQTVAAATARAGRSPIRRESAAAAPSRGVSMDSPRMNSSGKIVFQSLERSSSSPSSFNGGPKYKQRGMERSYSANVRVTPVLNVRVCPRRGSSKSGSVFGFGQLFSTTQKNPNGATTTRQQSSNSRTNLTESAKRITKNK